MTDLFTKSDARLKRRHASERRFKILGILAILTSLGFLIAMVFSIAWTGKGALQQTFIAVEFDLAAANISRADIETTRFDKFVKQAMRERFPEVTKRRDKRKLYNILSADAAFELKDRILENPEWLDGKARIWLTASDDIDMLVKGNIDTTLDESSRRISDMELAWVDKLRNDGDIERHFNWRFFTSGDSREPELAGILGALTGSAFTLLVCFLFSFPIGIMAAIYLEEFAPKNLISDFIEVNINNLAAVPSIVFGLLGLSIFLNVFGLPRSSPLVGGMVLSLMTLPTIIIASRAALRAVPPSIREAALGLGASKIQSTFHHVAPLALPGMLTGAIVGMARALGETAPLLMIGMVAFIVDTPKSIMEPATALPVQIFLWADSPERAFLEKTSAAIVILLMFLVIMNLAAIMLRKKYELRF